MGVLSCKAPSSPEDETNKLLEKEIKVDQNHLKLKVLLLGAGDSGKSTFFKRMVLIHGHGFSDLEVNRSTRNIRENIFTDIKLLAFAVTKDEKRGWKKISPEAMDAFDYIVAKDEFEDDEPDIAGRELWINSVVTLWADPHIKEIYANRTRFGITLSTNCTFFLDNAAKCLAFDYVPTPDEILSCRSKTTGVHFHTFEFPTDRVSIQLVDVGGQKSERRKWINQFEEVDLVIFFSPLDGFSLESDDKKTTTPGANRLEDDLALFSSLMDSGITTKAWLFFQNKKDLFHHALKQRPLNNVFSDIPPEYGTDPKYCADYLKKLFLKRWKGQAIQFYQTCGLDSEQMSVIYHSLRRDLLGQKQKVKSS